ncbi:hypothetical protein ACKKBG_A37835 [Auxenochlorella protothecoides x Auxenochlorella symbiontica]
MPLPIAGWAVAVAAVSAVVTYLAGNTQFAPGACSRLEAHAGSFLVGQDLALRLATDAICDHLDDPNPARPLILSAHGPPGVGKSLFHLLAAQALYSKNPSEAMKCPGHDCSGYKVMYGMDYVASERAEQQGLLRSALIDHVRRTPEALIVVEEYDKLDCGMRGFFRQFLENGAVGNVTLNKAIILLESNLGYLQLLGLLKASRSRAEVTAEQAQRVLKDLIFERWERQACEDRTDTLKMVGLVDIFLPFFPLEASHLRALFEARLERRSQALAQAGVGRLMWDAAVLDFLISHVEFDGAYPLEGAKEVAVVLTKTVSRPVRRWAEKQQRRQAPASAGKGEGADVSHCTLQVVKPLGRSRQLVCA